MTKARPQIEATPNTMNVGNSILRGLPRRLVNNGLLDETAAVNAITEAQQGDISLTQYLVESGLLLSRDIAFATAHEFGLPLLDLDAISIESCPKDAINQKLVEKHLALPLNQKQSRLQIAVGDPTNHNVINEIRFQAGVSVEPVVVEYDKLKIRVAEFLTGAAEELDSSFGDMDDVQLDSLDVEAMDDDDDVAVTADVDDAPVVRFVNKMLLDAIKKGASDLHFEPYEKLYRVRFRTDGLLEEMAKPPVSLAPRLAARLKVMSRMDISERRMPQDGRIKLKVSKTRAIDFRVNTLPTQYGEKIVLRILDPSSAQLGIEALGYDDDQKQAYMEALAQPQGMILVTGPTGSGKTVSLYTGLNILNTAERNISTAEDPIEINLEGINQVQVNARVGLTFAEALRAFLRQDPDIVMVGEIRDLETAEIAIKAAQTGHLVLSTLHTNSAPETLTRLANMGVPAFNVATSVSLIIAQRLARRLCNECKQPADLPNAVLTEAGFDVISIPKEDITLYEAVGCAKCGQHGAKGRTGIYEVLKMSPAISRIIMEGGNSLEIADIAKEEGFRTLRQSALMKAAQGIISLEEANRVTKD